MRLSNHERSAQSRTVHILPPSLLHYTGSSGLSAILSEPHTNENYDQTTRQQCLTKMQTRTTFNTLLLTHCAQI